MHCRIEFELRSGNIYFLYPTPNVMPFLQPTDQAVIRITKCYYQRDFLRKLVNREGTVKDF
jgi:hypothetical protein